ncbi:hypothetical protein [Roseateles saccharophilus]|uniref:Uncharacterized protein n=1 Tax=Roseateles saccharophilus TaxID=304 RepID=A0A4R3VEF5_ROSSA|nr:hypothetical protein [Roseateles saccharophilus]MDG0833010.1 hypothetical protein [Roseateles saccharophilus]TCV02102.1 hypothetical protein EV671_1005137 [Roseateles saccharophilus]
MKTSLIAAAVSATLALLTGAAMAQTPAAPAAPVTAQTTVQRDVNQQQRIENGLQSGKITTREAGQLERDEAKVDRLQAKDMKDGKLSPAERRQLRAAQNKASRDIKTAETNGVNGNPLSASSQRMQADVQRNVNQEKRVENGLQSGALTKREAAGLERGQAHVDGAEAHAAADGNVGAGEQKRLQHAENRQSARIHHAKTNAKTAG